jgi:hypothetical protein
VVLLTSHLGRFSAAPSGSAGKPLHPNGAPLLPKLRGHFAEFLNEGSPDRLGILYPPTCVGLRYGHLTISLEAFLGGIGSTDLPSAYLRLTIAPQAREADLPTSVIALQAWTSQAALGLPFRVPPSRLDRSQVVREYQPVVHRLRLTASA